MITFEVGQPAIVAASVGEAQPMAPIPDNRTAGVASVIPIARLRDRQAHQGGDRHRASLHRRPARRAALADRAARDAARAAGGTRDNVVATYESTPFGALSPMIGQPMQGDWMLRVSDRAAQDTGTLRSWKLELSSSLAGVSAGQVVVG